MPAAVLQAKKDCKEYAAQSGQIKTAQTKLFSAFNSVFNYSGYFKEGIIDNALHGRFVRNSTENQQIERPLLQIHATSLKRANEWMIHSQAINMAKNWT